MHASPQSNQSNQSNLSANSALHISNIRNIRNIGNIGNAASRAASFLPANNSQILEDYLRNLRLTANDARNSSAGLAGPAGSTGPMAASGASGPSGSSGSQRRMTNKNKKKNRNVSFSHTSKMHMYESEALTPADKELLFVTKADRIRMKKDTAVTIRDIRKTFKAMNQMNQSGVSGVIDANNANDAMQAIPTIQTVNPIQAEEIIGIETLLHGMDHARKSAEKKIAIARAVVLAYHHLQYLRHRQLDQLYRHEQTNIQEGIVRKEEIDAKVAGMYQRLSKKSAVQALQRAEYVRELNEASDPNDALDEADEADGADDVCDAGLADSCVSRSAGNNQRIHGRTASQCRRAAHAA